MWICLMLIGAVFSTPTDEFGNIEHGGEFSLKHENLLKQIVPGFPPSQDFSESRGASFSNLFSKDNQLYNTFNNYVEKGVTKKGLTFNIYDDDMREAAVALFRLLKETWSTDKTGFEKLKKWVTDNINSSMMDYAFRLSCLFSAPEADEVFLPPFFNKPNYFVNGDTIMKAFYYLGNNGTINEDVKKIYQINDENDEMVFINANYSRCNTPLEVCDAQNKYFTEDVALNSYYYGLQLLHPFWMSDQELNEVNPDHAAQYYFAHQQLYARYLLEKEHLDADARMWETKFIPDFLPHLFYENGLSFPTRTTILGRKIRKDVTYLQTLDIAMTECLKRGLVPLDNGTLIRMTDDNYMNLLAKYIRSQVESIKAAKLIRSVFGYANSGYPVDIYNPAPSVMHHPQTALRDPVYWLLIRRVVDYFTFYTNSTENYDISKYETNDVNINNIEVPNISTTYDYYFINLYNSFVGDNPKPTFTPQFNVFARQKRLNYKPFVVNFSVDSKIIKDVTIRIFLGPQCSITDCWEMHFRFFQLDSYRLKLNKGSNNVTWTPDTSSRYSSDHTFNKYTVYDKVAENYDIFKFPKNLIIPKGREVGLNLTMFIMILDEDENKSDTNYSTLYMQVTSEISTKPLGFPFHKKVDPKTLNNNAPNYRFFNITVLHERGYPDNTGYFSPNLY